MSPNQKEINMILDLIASLPISDQAEVSRTLVEQIQYRAKRALGPGVKVSFRTKNYVTVQGVVEKVNGKSVKVRANMDRYGNATPYPVNWTVSPQLLTVVA